MERILDVVATAENFKEAAYLEANPDVARWVRLGAGRSGRMHFQKYGIMEGRCVRIRVPDKKARGSAAHCAAPASHQNAVDLFAGNWVCALPGEFGLKAGVNSLFSDERIIWMLKKIGGVKGFRILELGSFEGQHAAMMLERGAKSVLGIEGNRNLFLKSLVVKNIMGLSSAQFLLGDFVSWMRQDAGKFDLVLASGVLYHMADPIGLLKLIAKRTRRLFLITHYYDQGLIEGRDPRALRFADTRMVVWRGRKIKLRQRNYGVEVLAPGFFGGPRSYAMWMEKADILFVLKRLGFKRFEVREDAAHPRGPSLWLTAER